MNPRLALNGNGFAIIKGTFISTQYIFVLTYDLGWNAETIQRHMPELTKEDIEIALEYENSLDSKE